MCSIFAYCAPDADPALVKEMLEKTITRGPDESRILQTKGGCLGFNRLAIMGLGEEGMQPFVRDDCAVVCNGELYGFRPLKQYLISTGVSFAGHSDCELLIPLYEKLGTAMFAFLDAEFALVLYDGAKNSFIAARDPIGIRPLYYGYDADGAILFASEAKNLVGVCGKIRPFPPGHWLEDGEFHCYRDPAAVTESCGTGELRGETASEDSPASGPYHTEDLETICGEIHDRLLRGIEKRLDADVPLGFLLSGGLDSSLVCGAAARLLPHPIETFAIGMDIDAIDLKYARQVAEYIHSNHHEVIITKEDVIAALEPVIAALGTWDITTIRASVGMYLVCKWIHENTDIRVVMTGEISDELFGYKYTDFAPDAAAFQAEAQKRIREIHMYDVLRADRCIAVNSLESRVPFGDLAFVDYVMHIDPEKKMNRYGIGKYLLRHAFEKDELIPREILMREKAAFSDAVGHSLVDDLKDYAEQIYTQEEFEERKEQYTYAAPFTKESLLYREIFEKYYPGQASMIADFWMPNREWEGCDVDDPSARVLSNYGDSGK